jgi:hypothetical protein
MHRISLGQPDVPVDSSSLVEPSVAEAGVHAEENIVLFAIRQKIRQVEAERGVSIIISPNETAVNENQRISEHSVELNPDPPSRIARGDFEIAAVPAHTVFRIAAAKRLVTVRLQLTVTDAIVVMLKREFNRPIVR